MFVTMSKSMRLLATAVLLATFVAAVAVLVTGGVPAGAQLFSIGRPAGGLDQSFGLAGTGNATLSPTLADRFQAVAARNGKTYAAGFVTLAGGDQAAAVARITPGGDLDPTFGTGGSAIVNVAPGRGAAEFARSIVVQSDGKIVIAGQHESTLTGAKAADLDMFAARFLPSGALDTTFGTGGVFEINLSPGETRISSSAFRTDQAYGLAVRPNDKLFWVTTRGPDYAARPGREDRDFSFIQLTKDGQLDTSFAADSTTPGIRFLDIDILGHLNQSPRQGMIQPDGKAVVASYTESDVAHPGGAIPHLIRLLENGNLDPSFGTGGVASFPNLLGPQFPTQTEFYDVGLQFNNKYVITGYAGDSPTSTVDMISARFNMNGTLDTSYGTNGLVRVDLAGFDDRGRDMTILRDGRVLMVGSGKPANDNLNALAVMLKSNGAFDSSFGKGGILQVDLGGRSDSYFGVALLNDGFHAFVGGWRGEAAAPASSGGAVSTGAAAGDNARTGQIRPGF
ncbi:MAG: hypothetical protein ACT4OM_04520 [Actinomycetota bacterium]